MYVLHAITVQQTNLQQDKLHVVLFVSSSLNESELQPQQYNTLHVRVIETKSIQYFYNIKMSQQFVR